MEKAGTKALHMPEKSKLSGIPDSPRSDRVVVGYLADERTADLRVQSLDLELVSYLRSSSINRVGRKLQHTGSLERYAGNAERPKMFFDMYDLIFLAKKNEINGEQHTNRVHAVRGNDPKSPTQLRPPFGFPQKPDESAKVAVGEGRLGSYKSLSRLVVDVNIIISISSSHIRRTRPSAGRSPVVRQRFTESPSCADAR